MTFASRWVWRLQRVTAAELLLLAEAQVALVGCQLARLTRPKGELLCVEAQDRTPAATTPEYREAARIGWAVTRAARHGLFRPKCLVRALAMQRMLRRRGIESSELRIGVRVADGRFTAHAWIELEGVVIGDTLKHVRTFTPATDFRLAEL